MIATMKNVYFIRHGETYANVVKMFQGCSPSLNEANLNEIGLAQARAIAQSLKDCGIEAIYSSPLARAYDTAQALSSVTGISIEKIPQLREISLTSYEGRITLDTREELGTDVVTLYRNGNFELLKSHYDLDKTTLDKYNNNFDKDTLIAIGGNLIKRWSSTAPEDKNANFGRPELVESKADLRDRAIRVHNRIARESPYNTIAIVGHGALLGAFYVANGLTDIHMKNGEAVLLNYNESTGKWNYQKTISNQYNTKNNINRTFQGFGRP